jgi:hypothetical protein
MGKLGNDDICKFCNDEGYIYTCLNCHKPAICDSEIGVVVCDTCFILGDKQNTYSEKCTNCNIADKVFDIPRVGDIIDLPSEDKINQLINWEYPLRFSIGTSYDIIRPIEVNEGILKYHSYVESLNKNISINLLRNLIIVNRRPTTISWTTNLKGLKAYLNEEMNKDLVNKNLYVKLLLPTGCSWNLDIANQNDIINKSNVNKNHLLNGVVIKIADLLNENLFFKNRLLKIDNTENYFFNESENNMYLIESIKKFELF